MNNVINNISKIINIELVLIKQLPVKGYLERAVHYLCKNKKTGKKYLLALAYSKAQVFRLKRLAENINYANKNWSEYFSFNMPLNWGECGNFYFVLFEYFNDAKRLSFENKEIEKIFKKIADENSYCLKLNKETRHKIVSDLIYQRCPDDDCVELLKQNEKYTNLLKVLEKYDELKMVHSHCDAKYLNVLTRKNKKYLIGFEYGGIDLPVGFDIYCIKKCNKDCDYESIPYLDLQEAIYQIQFVPNTEPWLKKHNPLVKFTKQNTIEINEDEITKILYIKRADFPQNNYEIDFKDIDLSSCAAYKIFAGLKKKAKNEKIDIEIKNCPYFFNGLTLNNKNNILSFSGILDVENDDSKNAIRDLKDSQIFLNYSRILPYVKPYWFRALMAVLICIPIGSLDAVIALSLKPYMDLVMVEKTVTSPWYIPFGIVAFTMIQGFLNYSATYLNTWVGGKITNDLKMTLYKKMLTFETGYFDRKKSGDIVFRFNNDADTACSGLLDNLKTFTSRLFSSISLIAVLFYNSWQLALIATVVLGGAFLPLANMRKRIKAVMDKSVSAGSAVITAYNETFAGNKTITSYNLAPIQENKFKNILSNIFTLKIKMIQRTSWLSPMMHVIVSIGIGLAIGYGSHLILTGKITSGNFVSFITALIMLYTPIKNLGNNFNSVQFSFMAIERVFKVLESNPAIKEKENPLVLNDLKDGIVFENVNFEYVKGKKVLNNINLNVKKGETIALVGNSGGGKSTIVSLIPRFYDVKDGTIKIDGINIKDYTLKSLRENISVVFQDNFLFSGTIKENILLGKQNATEEEINQALKMAYLDEFITTLKDGINTQIGERGILLSGGQKQRVAIARAFIKNAPIVILDEATSALDNKSEAIVQRAIDNLMKDKTVFVIAHRLSTIKNADRIAVINEGNLVELGSHDELIEIENGQYRMLYDMQFRNSSNPQISA